MEREEERPLSQERFAPSKITSLDLKMWHAKMPVPLLGSHTTKRVFLACDGNIVVPP
jgi:hypothetical protein